MLQTEKITNLAKTSALLIRLPKLAKLRLTTLQRIPTVNFNAVDIQGIRSWKSAHFSLITITYKPAMKHMPWSKMKMCSWRMVIIRVDCAINENWCNDSNRRNAGPNRYRRSMLHTFLHLEPPISQKPEYIVVTIQFTSNSEIWFFRPID